MKRCLSALFLAALFTISPAFAAADNANAQRFTFEFHAEPLVEVLTFISRKTHVDLVPDASLPPVLVTDRLEAMTLADILAGPWKCVFNWVRTAERAHDHRRKRAIYRQALRRRFADAL